MYLFSSLPIEDEVVSESCFQFCDEFFLDVGVGVLGGSVLILPEEAPVRRQKEAKSDLKSMGFRKEDDAAFVAQVK